MKDKILINEDTLMQQSILLCAELDIAGEAIYQGIRRYESTKDNLYPTDADAFYFLYQISIGLERLIKITHRLLQTKDSSFQYATSHNLVALNSATSNIHLDAKEQELLVILSEFYNKARYSHLNPKPESKIPELRDRLYKLDVASLASSIARKYYAIISDLSRDIGIFAYELRYGSSSAKLFYKVSRINERRAFREFIIALIAAHRQSLSKTGQTLIAYEPIADIYESYEFFETIRELEKGPVPQDLIDAVDAHYNELEPAERKQREDMLEIFSANLVEDLLKDYKE